MPSSHWPWERRLRQVPTSPGVYFFLGADAEVLYVGKAKNLRKRIQSYRRKASLDRKTRLMLSQVEKLRWVKEESELDALLVEAHLVRTHAPKYNLRLKDDRSPIYIHITDEPYPRVLLRRRSDLPEKQSGKIFGPFPSATQTREVVDIARRIFPFCNASLQQKRATKPCFFVHLKLCPGACTGKISTKEYAKVMGDLKLFLQGKRKIVETKLRKEMLERAKTSDFEAAALKRDQLQALKNLIGQHLPHSWEEEYQVSDRTRQSALLLLWKVLSPFLESVAQNPPHEPYGRIEGYDISNISGKDATASMVVFTKGLPQRDLYRRFRIRLPQTPNDPAMLAEVIWRRMRHREWPYPDLMIVDGGKTQVMAARKALASLGLHHRIPVLGIAKRLEQLVLKKGYFHILTLPKRSQALQLIMHIRDEAHRYARSYHHLLRTKTVLGQSQSA